MTTPVLAINGINVGSIMALGTLPAEPRRDIGEVTAGSDGALVPTRLSTKRDLTFTTKQLSGADAFVWEGLLKGDSEVWSFDTGKYSSKGVAGDGTGTTIQGSIVKFGAGALKIPNGDQWETSGLGIDAAPAFTAAVWQRIDGGAWHHWAWKGGSNAWLDGVFTIAAAHPFDTDTGEIILSQTGGTNYYFDDLVVSPFSWPVDWPAKFFAAGQPFGRAPYVTASGLLVREATTRSMQAQVSGSSVLKGNLGDGAGLQSDLRVLAVTLQEV